MTIFHGLSAFPLTPASADGVLEPDLFRRSLDRIIAVKVDSIGLLGSTGGYAYLAREQRQRAVRVAVEAAGGRVPLVVGVSALRTDEARLLARDARQAGADGLLLAPMSYLPLTDEEVFQHFAAVAEAGELPLCIYNNPSTTKFVFTDDLITRLAALPHIAAVKMPLTVSGDYAGELRRLRSSTPENFAVGYSGDWGAADALLAGADAWYSVCAGLLPEPALKLVRAAQDGDADKAKRLDAAFQPLWALFKAHGSFRVMYALAESLGVPHGLPPRPIMPLPQATTEQVRIAIEFLGAETNLN